MISFISFIFISSIIFILSDNNSSTFIENILSLEVSTYKNLDVAFICLISYLFNSKKSIFITRLYLFPNKNKVDENILEVTTVYQVPHSTFSIFIKDSISVDNSLL